MFGNLSQKSVCLCVWNEIVTKSNARLFIILFRFKMNYFKKNYYRRECFKWVNYRLNLIDFLVNSIICMQISTFFFKTPFLNTIQYNTILYSTRSNWVISSTIQIIVIWSVCLQNDMNAFFNSFFFLRRSNICRFLHQIFFKLPKILTKKSKKKISSEIINIQDIEFQINWKVNKCSSSISFVSFFFLYK